MNIIDVIIVVVLILGFVRGAMRGLIIELASLLAIIAGIYGAIHFSYFAIDFLSERLFWDEKYIQIAGFAITFLFISVLIFFTGKMLTELAGLMALGVVNRVMGGVFGLIKFAFVLSVILMFIEGFNKNITFIHEGKFRTSVLFQPVKKIAPLILPPILEGLDELKETDKFEETEKELNA